MDVKGLVIHCSDSPQGRGDDVESIHRWHTQRGFDGIGYHYVIVENGQVNKGRPNYWNGAHANGYNTSHLGICLIGVDKFTEKQFYSLKLLIRELSQEFGFTTQDVVGHYEISSKTCPNFDVTKFLSVV